MRIGLPNSYSKYVKSYSGRALTTRRLSGIGAAAHLASHNIPLVHDLPSVGANLFDHMMLFRYWKLRHPEKGLALGSPSFGGPNSNYEKGGPVDWLVVTPIPHEGLKAAIEKDAGVSVPNDHPLLNERSHVEMTLLYAAVGAEAIGLKLPMDGTSIMTFTMGCLPTSRGSVTLASTNPLDAPVIDPNYYATEVDRHVMREGYRMQSRVMFETAEGKELVAEEHIPDGFTSEELGVEARDETIDRRVGVGGTTVFHPAGTAAMGKVVGGDLRVNGTEGLRVVDASVVSTIMAEAIIDRNSNVTDDGNRYRSLLLRIIRLLCMQLRSRQRILSRVERSVCR